MNYRRAGSSGLKVSELCLGAWINFGDRIAEEETFAVLDAAVEEGINFLDTADVYAGGRAEEVMGRWMKGKDRRTLVIATKCRGRMWDGPNGEAASRKHIFEAVEDSLRRLQTDYIDLYQIHWPDPDTPAEETVRALDDLVRAGKIRYFGWSNHDAGQIAERARLSETLNASKAISLQNYYNMLGRGIEDSIIPRCQEEGIGQIPYSPLAQGLLSDKYLTGEAPEGSRGAGNADFEKRLREVLPTLQALAAFAQECGATLSQLALAWLLHQPTMVAPIIGATRPQQIHENVKATEIKLSPDELARIDTILQASK
ncbi:MAG: aldo/keto reductase [Armatimonadota bacterium]|nr:aldo/keto reductase [Armatimonadota bacterium]